MRLLLDSHTLIWAADDPAKLSPQAQGLIQDPSHDRLLSAATLWEIGIKFGLGKLPLSLPYRQWMDRAIGPTALLLGTGFIYSLLEPNFGWNERSLTLFISLVVSQGVLVAMYEGGKAWLYRRALRVAEAAAALEGIGRALRDVAVVAGRVPQHAGAAREPEALAEGLEAIRVVAAEIEQQAQAGKRRALREAAGGIGIVPGRVEVQRDAADRRAPRRPGGPVTVVAAQVEHHADAADRDA